MWNGSRGFALGISGFLRRGIEPQQIRRGRANLLALFRAEPATLDRWWHVDETGRRREFLRSLFARPWRRPESPFRRRKSVIAGLARLEVILAGSHSNMIDEGVRTWVGSSMMLAYYLP